jgi:hypothetical protein
MLQAASQRQKMTITFTLQRKKDFRNSTTLLGVAFFFIASQSPKIIPDIYEAWYCSYIKVSFVSDNFIWTWDKNIIKMNKIYSLSNFNYDLL